MDASIDAPRDELSDYAPKVEMVTINPEKVGMLIGPGGKQIRKLKKIHRRLFMFDGDKGEVYLGKYRDS